jgi:hypothetical protein
MKTSVKIALIYATKYEETCRRRFNTVFGFQFQLKE